MGSFLHGIETKFNATPPSVPPVADSSIIAIVGTAPIHKRASGQALNINSLTLVSNELEAVRLFGAGCPGYSLPSALRAIFKDGDTTVLVVNVFDPDKHVEKVTLECEIVNGVAYFKNWGKGRVVGDVISVSIADATVDVDYKVNRKTFDVELLPDGHLASSGTVSLDIVYAVPTAVTPADIIGGISSGGVKSGLALFGDAHSKYGYNPRILLAPSFCTAGVASELARWAEVLKAICVIDVPVGASFNQVIEGRGGNGSLNLRLASDRVVYTYPHVVAFDPDYAKDTLQPLSQFFAAAIVSRDRRSGFHVSVSNSQLTGITGLETHLTSGLDNVSSEVNILNSRGIVTVYNSYGTGYRVWGNRSAKFPSSTDSDTFICIRRTMDIIASTIENSLLDNLDRPINEGYIGLVKQKIQAFLNSLVTNGVLNYGKCFYYPEKNTPESLASGVVCFTYELSFAYPCEHIILEQKVKLMSIDISEEI